MSSASGHAMRRREFISLIAGATTLPLVARAQRAGKPQVIGVIANGTVASTRPFAEITVQRLGELGWVEGRDVVVEYRYAEGSLDRAAEAAAEFARMNVDIILVSGDSQALAVKRATDTIPIVVTAVGDAVGSGLIKSLAHPGGNITGMTVALSETAGKRLELLRELASFSAASRACRSRMARPFSWTSPHSADKAAGRRAPGRRRPGRTAGAAARPSERCAPSRAAALPWLSADRRC